MSLVTNVVRRGKSYYFRVRVPKPLRTKVRPVELWRSLRTSDPSTARKRAGAMMALTEALWSALHHVMSPETIDHLISEWLTTNLDDDANERDGLSRRPFPYAILGGTPLEPVFVRGLDHHELPDQTPDSNGLVPLVSVDLADGEWLASNISRSYPHDVKQAMRLMSAEDDLRRRNITVVENDVAALLAERGIAHDRDDDAFFDACMAMLRARAELWKEVRERSETNWRPPSGSVQTITPTSPTHTERGPARKMGVTLSEGAKAFVPHVTRTDHLKPKRSRDYEVSIRMFIEWVGSDLDLADVTAEQAGAFMNALSLYPANGSKRPMYRDLDFRGRVELATEKGEEAVLNPDTIAGKYLTPLRRMFDWYRKSGHSASIPTNPFEGIKPSKRRRMAAKDKRRPFTDREVSWWLSLPLFTGAKATSQAGLYQGGELRVSDWRYWLPLISLFTGARPSELLGLTLADIKEAEKVHYFSVRDLGDHQSIKNELWRQVPVHSQLIQLGLLKFVETRRKKGETRLFDIEPGAGGYLSDKPSKFFNNMIRRITDPDPDRPGKLVLYSTRHTVISKLRAAGVRQDVSMQLVGHEDGVFHDVHAGYGDHSLLSLRDAVNKVTYDGVDWDALSLPNDVLAGKRPY